MLIVNTSLVILLYGEGKATGAKKTLTTARELKLQESESEAARGGVRSGGVLNPIRSENGLPPLQAGERGRPGPAPV